MGVNDCDLARTTRSPRPGRCEGHHRRDQGWSITERQRQIFSWLGSVTRAVRDGECHLAAARICQWVRRFPPGQGRPPSSMIPLRPRGLAPSMLVRSPKPIVRLIFDGTAVRVWLDRIHRVDPGVRPRFAVSLCLLTARTPRRSGHRHRCVAYRADSARAE